MMKHRFEVTSVDELNRDNKSFQPSEIIPLIDIQSEIPSSSSSFPLVPSITTINETKTTPTRSYNSSLQQSKISSSAIDLHQDVDSSSLPIVHTNSNTNTNVNGKIEEIDSTYATTHSNNYDTNSFSLTNKFLYELRLKRRELREKTKNLSIEQRIALNRYQHNQNRKRAQDIFDVSFESSDNDDLKDNLFNQDLQEKIRNNIFNELDRQQMKQYYKQKRQLVLGRAMFMVFISLLTFMSFTLIYVVIDLYDRAQYLDTKLPDNKFISMIYDKISND
ncbi:unnamed protein product [Rotaria sp. Silwood1]|nr:unnamed protein product [Rotaria sp. Silwood1]CAF1625017.1 unnamed protein product [Rotaria sp. Silwood1]CAF3695773.1 unnamed protein product [Rotaria sp. Silwood1]CAF3780507.1 unnamed protein product [Rotaria sp. Silwood1]CAF3782780.1 unnamed protein product [Rotaria sp. Silwood1]